MSTVSMAMQNRCKYVMDLTMICRSCGASRISDSHIYKDFAPTERDLRR
jgi:hypothetical protein